MHAPRARVAGTKAHYLDIPILDLTDPDDDFTGPARFQKQPLRNVHTGSLDNVTPAAGASKAQPPRLTSGNENAPPNLPTRVNASGDASSSQAPSADSVIVHDTSDILVQVLEVVPDVQVAYAQQLIEENKAIEAVLNALFENPTYPKIEKSKGKRKAEEPLGTGTERGVPKPKVDYTGVERPIPTGSYYDLAMEQLQIDFPFIPKPHIRTVLHSRKCFYVPTVLELRRQGQLTTPPYRKKTVPYRSKGKLNPASNPDFLQELEWLRSRKEEEKDVIFPAASSSNAGSGSTSSAPAIEEEGGIDCGCCFTAYPFEKMVQCPDAHLFCTECMVSYSENLLGSHNPNIICMDQSGYDKLWELYGRVKQRKEIEAAGLEGLEECPFCEYKVVIDNPDEKLFRCEREECGAVSCRACKKLDHLPKTCKEVSEDVQLGGQHAVEEAMTKALLRNCPKCQKVFIKESGPNAPQPSGTANKCLLWEEVEHRHANEVKAAAEQAMANLRRENPEIDATAIKVDVPKAPKPRANAPGMPGIPMPPIIPVHAVGVRQVRQQAELARQQAERARQQAELAAHAREVAARNEEHRILAAARGAVVQQPAQPMGYQGLVPGIRAYVGGVQVPVPVHVHFGGGGGGGAVPAYVPAPLPAPAPPVVRRRARRR
ncbi:hypothetical protein ONZ45_g14302 [Pleurotus djamor]|nr:hypothetical protein ONZ45_g14302 [Pleurotus djamor]